MQEEWTLDRLDALRPRNRDDLRRLVRRVFGIDVPDRAVCPGDAAPTDYLAASFFEQEDLLVWANRGGGKTYLAAVATLLNALFHRPLTVLVLGGSFDQSDRLADYLRELLAAQDALRDGPMTRRRIRLAGGSEIRIVAQSQRSVRGQHVQKIRCDEADLFDEGVWRAVQFATRSLRRADGAQAGVAAEGDASGGVLVAPPQTSVRGSIEVLSTLHRPGGLMQRLVRDARGIGHDGAAVGGYRLIQWCLWEVIERCPPWRKCADCPLAPDCRGVARDANGFFPIDDAIAIQARSSRAAWEAEMLCLGAQREHRVFPEFDAARHVRPLTYCPDFPLYRAIDFGYRSPLVCLWIQVTPAGCVHVVDEHACAGLAIDAHGRAILSRDPGPAMATFVDPAGNQRSSGGDEACTQILGAMGIPCASRKSKVREGLDLIRCALAPAGRDEPALLLDPRCAGLIDAFENYHYAPMETRAGVSEEPVKDGPDHWIDALRYFYVNRRRPRQETPRGSY